MWTETKNNRKKSKMQILKKQKEKRSGLEIWWKGTLPPKFGINLLDGFRENGFYDGQTDDGRPRDDSSSAVQ